MKSGVYAIDPGTKSTGWALWRKCPSTLYPQSFGLWTAKDQNWEQRLYTIGKQAAAQFAVTCPSLVVLEQPEYYGHDAATASQAIIKLAIMVGYLKCVANNCKADVRLVPVSTWKGQMSKDVVKRRIRSMLGASVCEPYTDDIWDAVGLGLYAFGKEI